MKLKGFHLATHWRFLMSLLLVGSVVGCSTTQVAEGPMVSIEKQNLERDIAFIGFDKDLTTFFEYKVNSESVPLLVVGNVYFRVIDSSSVPMSDWSFENALKSEYINSNTCYRELVVTTQKVLTAYGPNPPEEFKSFLTNLVAWLPQTERVLITLALDPFLKLGLLRFNALIKDKNASGLAGAPTNSKILNQVMEAQTSCGELSTVDQALRQRFAEWAKKLEGRPSKRF